MVSMKMRKRGVLEIQLHWIFVLIAGAVILSLFIGFVARQRAAAETSLVFDVSNELDLLISGAKTATGLIPVDIYDMQIDFSCQEYRIKDQRQSLLGRPVFASETVKDGDLLLWSVPWKIPFKIDNILYATSPKVRFVFINADDRIYGLIPRSINKVNVGNLNDIEDEGDYK
ncbi:hypothetical protein KY316_01485, partial [Candidatus Woesearchaeota archaeon]|nr:hypothetical protein [Candidatus Woesearchaeota archaeon]